MATGGSCEAFKSFCIGRLGGMVPARRRNGDLNLSRWSLTWWVKLINWLIRFRTFFGILESLGFGKCVFTFQMVSFSDAFFIFCFQGCWAALSDIPRPTRVCLVYILLLHWACLLLGRFRFRPQIVCGDLWQRWGGSGCSTGGGEASRGGLPFRSSSTRQPAPKHEW